jgi:hypothetical protein
VAKTLSVSPLGWTTLADGYLPHNHRNPRLASQKPDDVHVVDRNASSTKPAKFLVFLIKDKGAPVLVPAN